ncbi:MAG: UbiH/UbiF family hydroxylase [Burkholderiales bacterium]|nr:UbiH/UbiF family hydroxylase [Burkholderiales bacterium]
MDAGFDIAVVGGGLVGLAVAAALRERGMRLALIEPQPAAADPAPESWDSRVYAISPGSAAFMEAVGAWQELAPARVTRVERMEIRGDDGTSRLEFSAYDAGLPALAYIVENRLLQRALQRAAARGGLDAFRSGCAALRHGAQSVILTLADGAEIAARLVIGADGADSWVRRAAGIAATPVDYGQVAVVANFSCERPHGGVAWQWFRRDGVLALLPLPGERASMVWSTARENGERLLALPAGELAAETAAASQGVLGALEVITPPAAFALRLQRVERFVAPRIALAGDAAHHVHPLAGQGVNLGFRDARELAAVLAGREARHDCGDYAVLRRYERARREDVAAVALATHGLQKLFGYHTVWIARTRNAGLKLVNLQPQLKNFLVRRAVA